MKMPACWVARMLTIAVLTTTAHGDQNEVIADMLNRVNILAENAASINAQNQVISTLLSRVDALAGRVTSLSDQVASLESRLTAIDGGQEEQPTDFRLVNVTQTRDAAASVVRYTVQYEAVEQPQVLMAYNERVTPKELTHQNGTLHFSVPDTEPLPMLYVRTTSNLMYTLIFMQASGPPRIEPEEFPNVVLTTSPDHTIPFEVDEEPEVVVTTHVTGTREIRKETLMYYAYILRDSIVDFTMARLLQETPSSSSSSSEMSNDVMADVNAGSDGEGSDDRRMRVVQHSREGSGRDAQYRVKLSPRGEESGVVYVEKRVEFVCRSCALYEIRVTKPMPYFLNDDSYSLPEGALVAYKDLYNFGPDFRGPRYVRFIRYDPSEGINTVDVTCNKGEDCEVTCSAFGDNPTAYFYLNGRSTRGQPGYYDQSGARLDDNSSGNAQVQGWSVNFGYEAFAVIRFRNIRSDQAGTFDCFAEISSGLMLRRQYVLRVV
ncbi:uncharacterized protein LOC143301899 isoform X2 [Babylonia areolata]|uniref:uncharacterized protein LOC143301899 isoform X2 n=1 Tax=Babylonia areolata TaxID=304850 RepID=UPI003FD0AD0E